MTNNTLRINGQTYTRISKAMARRLAGGLTVREVVLNGRIAYYVGN